MGCVRGIRAIGSDPISVTEVDWPCAVGDMGPAGCPGGRERL